MKDVKMAIEDKIKWNEKYKSTPKLLEKREVGQKLREALTYATIGHALDIASGAGKNSIFLAENNFEVESLDISSVALDVLKSKGYKNITTKLIDLDGYNPMENCYDFIVMTNYLDREIIPKLAKALKKKGILFIETYMAHEINTKKTSNPDYLLKKDELKTFFDESYTLLDYSEFDNEPFELYRMKKQSIIIQKI